MNDKLIVLKPDELAIIETMRKHGPYASFTVEKKPSKENPDGELVRIVIETSKIVSNITNSVV